MTEGLQEGQAATACNRSATGVLRYVTRGGGGRSGLCSRVAGIGSGVALLPAARNPTPACTAHSHAAASRRWCRRAEPHESVGVHIRCGCSICTQLAALTSARRSSSPGAGKSAAEKLKTPSARSTSSRTAASTSAATSYAVLDTRAACGLLGVWAAYTVGRRGQRILGEASGDTRGCAALESRGGPLPQGSSSPFRVPAAVHPCAPEPASSRQGRKAGAPAAAGLGRPPQQNGTCCGGPAACISGRQSTAPGLTA